MKDDNLADYAPTIGRLETSFVFNPY